MLSTAWEAAGGIAVRYDNRYDDWPDFVNDDEFWAGEYENPADMYHFAFPCHHMSMAWTTPNKPRHMDRPYGDEGDMETAYYNMLVRLAGMRILALGLDLCFSVLTIVLRRVHPTRRRAHGSLRCRRLPVS